MKPLNLVLCVFALFIALTNAAEISKWEDNDFRCIFFCKCQILEGMKIASCTHKNITRPPINGFPLPRGTQVADLSYNRFYVLKEYIFQQFFTSGSQGKELQVLNISSNLIQRISTKAFMYIDNLKKLDLSHNKIKVIYPKTFKYLTKLEELYLQYNDVRSLTAYAFEGLKSLKILDLSNGKLTQIKWWAFSLSNEPILLNLQNNRLKTFHSNYIYTPTHFHFKIDLNNNPIKCDCDLQRVFEDNRVYGEMGAINLTCSNPPHMSGFHFTALMPEDFRGCQEPMILPTKNKTVVGVVNKTTTISCETIPGPQFKNWSIISRSDNLTVLPDRFTVSQSETWVNLTIVNTSKSDEGEYKCDVSERLDKSMRKAYKSITLKVVD